MLKKEFLNNPENKKCAKKLKMIFSYSLIVLIIIMVFLPFLIPIIILSFVYLFLNKKMSLEKILKSIGLFDCFEIFKKEYKQESLSLKIKDYNNQESTINKKKEILKKREELAKIFGQINLEKETLEIEEMEKEIVKKEIVEKEIPDKKEKNIIYENKYEEKNKKSLFNDTSKKLNKTSSSIWDDYDSVMDDFKK